MCIAKANSKIPKSVLKMLPGITSNMNGASTEPGTAAIANKTPLLTSIKPDFLYAINPEILLIDTKAKEVPAAISGSFEKKSINTGAKINPPPAPTKTP